VGAYHWTPYGVMVRRDVMTRTDYRCRTYGRKWSV